MRTNQESLQKRKTSKKCAAPPPPEKKGGHTKSRILHLWRRPTADRWPKVVFFALSHTLLPGFMTCTIFFFDAACEDHGGCFAQMLLLLPLLLLFTACSNKTRGLPSAEEARLFSLLRRRGHSHGTLSEISSWVKAWLNPLFSPPLKL